MIPNRHTASLCTRCHAKLRLPTPLTSKADQGESAGRFLRLLFVQRVRQLVFPLHFVAAEIFVV
jgi:hypothetical protein